jgi:hypothetical protein
VAARIRRELKVDVDTVHGKYGEYKVLVDGKQVIDGGPLAVMGVLPAPRKTIAAVRQALESPPG